MTINKLVDQYVSKYSSELYFAFRLIVGLMFVMNGAKKLGLTGGDMASGQFLLAGIIEFAAGLAIALGAYVPLAAVAGAAVMLVAFLTVHVPKGLNPMTNGGERALLYLAAFLVLAVYGPGKWTVMNTKKKK